MILYSMVDGDPWGQLLLVTLAIPLLAAMKGAMRTIAVSEAMPEWKAKAAGMELGVPSAGAGGAIFIFVEFYYVAADQEHPLARHSLRAGDAEHDAHH